MWQQSLSPHGSLLVVGVLAIHNIQSPDGKSRSSGFSNAVAYHLFRFSFVSPVQLTTLLFLLLFCFFFVVFLFLCCMASLWFPAHACSVWASSLRHACQIDIFSHLFCLGHAWLRFCCCFSFPFAFSLSFLFARVASSLFGLFVSSLRFVRCRLRLLFVLCSCVVVCFRSTCSVPWCVGGVWCLPLAVIVWFRVFVFPVSLFCAFALLLLRALLVLMAAMNIQCRVAYPIGMDR